MNLLEHEMRIAALLRRICIPGDAFDLGLSGPAVAVQDLNSVCIDAGDVAVPHANDILGIRKESWNVRCHKDGRAAFSYYQGALLSRADDIWRACGHHCYGIGALHLFQGFESGSTEVSFVVEVDEVS